MVPVVTPARAPRTRVAPGGLGRQRPQALETAKVGQGHVGMVVVASGEEKAEVVYVLLPGRVLANGAGDPAQGRPFRELYGCIQTELGRRLQSAAGVRGGLKRRRVVLEMTEDLQDELVGERGERGRGDGHGQEVYTSGSGGCTA